MSSAALQKGGRLAAFTVCLVSLSAGPSRASNTTYVYDANGRLVSSTRTVGLTEQYGFDNADNRSTLNSSRQGSGNTAPQAAAAQPATVSTQAAAAQPAAVSSTQATTASGQSSASSGP